MSLNSYNKHQKTRCTHNARKDIPKKVPETDIRPRQGINNGNPTDETEQGSVGVGGNVEQAKVKA